MSTAANTPENIPAGAVVVGTDGSAGAERAAAWAAEVAVEEDRPLVLAHAAPAASAWMLPPIDYPSFDDELEEAGEEVLAGASRRLLATVGGLGPDRLSTVCGRQQPEELLLHLSRTAHLLVVGSRGHGRLRSTLLGSVSSALARRTRCPLVVVPDATTPGGRGVVVGVGGTAESVPTASFAFRAASWRHEPLTVVHTFWDPEYAEGRALAARPHTDLAAERLLVTETIAGLNERYPDVEVRVELDRELPEDTLAELSQDAALVVVGTREHDALVELALGSVATALIRHARCPIAVIPSTTAGHALSDASSR